MIRPRKLRVVARWDGGGLHFLVHPLPLHVAVSNDLGEDYVAKLQPRYSICTAVHCSEQQAVTRIDHGVPTNLLDALQVFIHETPPLLSSQVGFKTDLVGTDTEIPMTLLACAVIPSNANGTLPVAFLWAAEVLLSWKIAGAGCSSRAVWLMHVCELSFGFGLQTGYGPLGMSRYAPE